MTPINALGRMQTVNGVRKTRLVRALADARAQEEQARREERAAQDALAQAQAQAEEADGYFAQNPACEQTRLWRSLSQDQKAQGDDRLKAARRESETSEHIRKEKVQAVHHHDLKTDRLDDHIKKLMRAEARSAEIRSED